MTTETRTPINTSWPMLLGLGTVLGSWAMACIFPFAAFATVAALTLSRRAGLALVASVWAANQFVGFFLLSFPWDAQAVGHGLVIGLTSVAAYFTARTVYARTSANPFLGAAAALSAAFVVYEVMLAAYAQVGGGAENFSGDIVALVGRSDALWFVGLMAARFVLTRAAGQKLLAQQA